MYFTPEEIAVLKENKIYKYYADTQWSTFTVATVLAHLDAVPKTSLESIPLIKFLLMIKKAKDAEETDQYRLNEELYAAIITAGGDPATNSYPQKQVLAGGAIAGGAGDFAAATLVSAVTGKKIFIEEVIIDCATATAGAGVEVLFRDGAGGTVLARVGANQYNSHVIARPYVAGTAATLLEWQGQDSTYIDMADGETVRGMIKYREI